MSVIWSPGAERDLNEIWEYVATDSVDAADRVVERLRSISHLLVDHPKSDAAAALMARES